MLTDTLIFKPQADPQTQFPQSSEGRRLYDAFQTIVDLPPDFPLFIYSRAHRIVPAAASDSASGGSGSFCNVKMDGGCDGRIVLTPLDPAKRNKRIALNFKLVKGQRDQGWLTLGWNPTTIVAGDNVHPASMPNAQTGEIVRWPSSAKDTLNPFFRLGFVLLDGFFQQVMKTKEPLFDHYAEDRTMPSAEEIAASIAESG